MWSEVLAEDFCYNFCSPGAFKPLICPESVAAPGEWLVLLLLCSCSGPKLGVIEFRLLLGIISCSNPPGVLESFRSSPLSPVLCRGLRGQLSPSPCFWLHGMSCWRGGQEESTECCWMVLGQALSPVSPPAPAARLCQSRDVSKRGQILPVAVDLYSPSC